MAYSSNLGTNLITTGDQSGTWGNTTNFNLGTLMEQAISSYCTQQFNNADITLTLVDGADAGGNTTPGTIYTAGTAAVPVSARNMCIVCQGTSSGNNLYVPNGRSKLYFIYNNITSGGGTITVRALTGAGTSVAVKVGEKVLLACDGTNVVNLLSVASATTNGYLTNTDWTTFNNKLTSVTADSPLTGAGTSASHLSIPPAASGVSGYLTGTDWDTFNNKQPAGAYITSVAVNSPLTGDGTSGNHLNIAAANQFSNGYLTASDWDLFNSKISAGQTVTLTNKRINPRVHNFSSVASYTPDIASYDMIAISALSSPITINAPTGSPVDGNKLVFRILDDGTSRAITWNATYTGIGVVLPSNTTVNKTTYVGCMYNADKTRWDVVASLTQG